MKDVPLYGAVMGIAGLGLAARSAAVVWPGVLRAPAYFTEPWVLLGAIALAALVARHALEALRAPKAVLEDFAQPQSLGFRGALPIGMSLVAGGVAPYAPPLGRALWWLSFAMLLVLLVWALARLLAGGVELAHFDAGWLLVLAGGIVLPWPGIGLGLTEASRFVFGISAAIAPLLMALLFYRAVVGPPRPGTLAPTWAILLVPPSLAYANGLALYPQLGFLEALYFFALALAAALFVLSRRFLGPFGPAWWAVTFPLDALAYAAARHAQDHPTPLWRALCAATLLLATAFVALVLVRTLLRGSSRRA